MAEPLFWTGKTASRWRLTGDETKSARSAGSPLRTASTRSTSAEARASSRLALVASMRSAAESRRARASLRVCPMPSRPLVASATLPWAPWMAELAWDETESALPAASSMSSASEPRLCPSSPCHVESPEESWSLASATRPSSSALLPVASLREPSTSSMAPCRASESCPRSSRAEETRRFSPWMVRRSCRTSWSLAASSPRLSSSWAESVSLPSRSSLRAWRSALLWSTSALALARPSERSEPCPSRVLYAESSAEDTPSRLEAPLWSELDTVVPASSRLPPRPLTPPAACESDCARVPPSPWVPARRASALPMSPWSESTTAW